MVIIPVQFRFINNKGEHCKLRYGQILRILEVHCHHILTQGEQYIIQLYVSLIK